MRQRFLSLGGALFEGRGGYKFLGEVLTKLEN